MAGVAARLSQAETDAGTAQLAFAELADTRGLSMAPPAVLGPALKELQSIAVGLHTMRMPVVAQTICAVMFDLTKQLLCNICKACSCHSERRWKG